MKFSLLLLSTALFIFSCKNEESGKTTVTDTSQLAPDTSQHTMPESPAMDTMPMALVNQARATISGTYTDTVVNGVVNFKMDPATGKVKMNLEVTIPSKAGKSVAVHIHEHGDCSNKGDSAHGHWNPTKAQHGKWATGSFHSGDIGNVKLDKNGKGTMELTTDLWSLGGVNAKNILRRSIIVHGGTDDYKSQPSGNAGSRIGCGVIQ